MLQKKKKHLSVIFNENVFFIVNFCLILYYANYFVPPFGNFPGSAYHHILPHLSPR